MKNVLYLDVDKDRSLEITNVLSDLGYSVNVTDNEQYALLSFNDGVVNSEVGYDAVLVGYYEGDMVNRTGAISISEVFSEIDMSVPLYLIRDNSDGNIDIGDAFFYGFVYKPFVESELEKSLRRFI